MMRKTLLAASVLALLGSGCADSEWRGIYYPDVGGTFSYGSPSLGSLEECSDWIVAMIKAHRKSGARDGWMCGRGCRMNGEIGKFECRETYK